jgi:threonine dehydrogenase-like Zn-dependent dehydrogenase
VPFAHVGLVKIPDGVSDDQAILVSDIFPTGWFAAKLAEIEDGDVAAVFGCGPVGQFAIASARLCGASRVIAIDGVQSRLQMARAQGAEVIDFEADDPIEALRELTGGIGADRVIDAVGVDAVSPHRGPGRKAAKAHEKESGTEREQVAADASPDGEQWNPGDAPGQALRWAVEAAAKAGTISVVGVYPPSFTSFPIGAAMNKNLTINMGNCNHRRYTHELLRLVETGEIDPAKILTQREPLSAVIDAYKAFDARRPGWVKVELLPAA